MEQHRRLGVVEQLAQLGRRQPRVEGQGDRAQPGRGEDGLQERRAVAHQDGDPVAGSDAAGA
ncbi:MAG TPA: hypothetical protein VLC53_13845 [Myxococcota bacterium]|nr:hypothetical protein [Myxococcota bacterium]